MHRELDMIPTSNILAYTYLMLDHPVLYEYFLLFLHKFNERCVIIKWGHATWLHDLTPHINELCYYDYVNLHSLVLCFYSEQSFKLKFENKRTYLKA